MNEPKHWLDRPQSATLLVRILYLACAALLLADLFYERHGHFEFEHWFGFFCGFGFLAYVFIVNAAKVLRRLIGRPETYYQSTPQERDHD